MTMGGEASMPLYYASIFLRRDVEVWLLCHDRVRQEVETAFPDLKGRVLFAADTRLQRLVHRLGQYFPLRIRNLVFGQALHFSTQRRLRARARDLIRDHAIDAVLEPSPITPKGLSFMYNLGAKVAIGPLCGGLDFPPAFRDLDPWYVRASYGAGRRLSELANLAVPGKRKADLLMVANDQTAAALPRGCRGRVVKVIESGVDLALWRARSEPPGDGDGTPGRPVRFAFSGRFVDWKGIEYLMAAFARVAREVEDCTLDLVGGGDLSAAIGVLAADPSLKGRVRLHGWLSRAAAAAVVGECDVFVMPSLRECGGAAILEAMALGKPVVATDWAGPGDYVNETCGIAVDPWSKDGFVAGLAEAMTLLARSPDQRARLGRGARARIAEEFLDWEAKADRVLELLRETVRGDGATPRREPPAAAFPMGPRTQV